MNVGLIIFEELVLLLGEVIWFESYLKAVFGLGRSFDVCVFALMHSGEQIELISLASLLSVNDQNEQSLQK